MISASLSLESAVRDKEYIAHCIEDSKKSKKKSVARL
jgi:hypothetical protein